MKKIIARVLTLVLIITLVGCNQRSYVNVANNETKMPQVANPMKYDVDPSSEEFLAMEIPLKAPDEAEDIVYNLIGEKVIETKFTLDQYDYTLRASKALEGQELHGVYEQLEDEVIGIDADGENYSYSMNIYAIKRGGLIAINTIQTLDQDSIYLTLVTTDTDTETIESIFTDVSMQVIECE